MEKIKSVLFVCTGNSCRSVMAEALLKKYLKAAGKESITVGSAGTGTFDGMPPTNETIDVLKGEGIELTGFRSKVLNAKIIKEADLILAMEDMHRDIIVRMAPEAAAKTHLLKEFGNPGPRDHEEGASVPDPVGRPVEFYKYVINMIKKEIGRIAELL